MKTTVKAQLQNAHVAAYWLNMADSLSLSSTSGVSFEGIRLMADFELEPKEFELSPVKSSGAQRQAAYAQRQREAGRVQRSLWLTDSEAVAVAGLLETLRLGD